MTRSVRLIALAICLIGCGEDGTVADPVAEPSLDLQLRATLAQWGAMPIAAVAPQNAALVDLGRSLFFDKILSGNRDVSCATCHDPSAGTTDGRALSIGTGGVGIGPGRELGQGRQHTPRNAVGLLGAALGNFSLFWDGRVAETGGPGRYNTPAGVALPTGLTSLLAAQAMFPVTNRVEMRGNAGDRDVSGAPNELASLSDADLVGIWTSVMRRVMGIDGYRQKFAAAYPGVPTTQLGFQHAANAIAAFETQAFSKTGSPFDRYLARDDNALTLQQKRGAMLFFGRARCSSCHGGPLLGGQQFANVGAPQVGPGTGKGQPLDQGREDGLFAPASRFFFRVPTLRNVELTAPYTHAGAYATLEAVVRHYNDVEKAVRNYDVSQLPPSLRTSYHGDAATIASVLSTLDGRFRQPLNLTDEEQQQLVSFLKSLTDPAAKELGSLVPSSVPSGLSIR